MSNEPKATRLLVRAADVGLGLVGLLVSLPMMALVAIAIKLTSQGPILFGQPRVAEGGRLFVLYYFRTTYVDRAYHNSRVTLVGRWLRRTRSDELPWNVVVGDTSYFGAHGLILQGIRAFKGQRGA